MSDMIDFIQGIVVGAMTISVIWLFALAIESKDFKSNQQIIEQGCGYYDPTTREFKWGKLK